jgi:hypothetical protein
VQVQFYLAKQHKTRIMDISIAPSVSTSLYLCNCILRRNCLLLRVIEGKIKGGIKVTGRRGRRRGKLLDDLKGRRGYSHLKEEA